MSTAQIIYEQYKVLPKRVRQELKNLISNEEETIEIAVVALNESIGQVKLIKQGKLKTSSARGFLAELKGEK